MRRRSALRMMTSLAISELLQTLFIALGGLYLITGWEMNYYMNHVGELTRIADCVRRPTA